MFHKIKVLLSSWDLTSRPNFRVLMNLIFLIFWHIAKRTFHISLQKIHLRQPYLNQLFYTNMTPLEIALQIKTTLATARNRIFLNHEKILSLFWLTGHHLKSGHEKVIHIYFKGYTIPYKTFLSPEKHWSVWDEFSKSFSQGNLYN